MRGYLLVAAVTAAAATLTGFAPAGGTPAGAAAPGAQLWAARYDGGAKSGDDVSAMAVSADGSRVFVTGDSYGGPVTGWDYATAAYDAATGRQLWVTRYSGPWKNADDPLAVAVSPDGSRVFVTGGARGWGANYDYATVAYAAATGRQLWASRYNDPGNGDDFGNSATVSPDGSTVFVTGESDVAYGTVAYSSATGRQLWVRRYNGPASGSDYGNAVVVGPDGSTVFVTGQSTGRRTGLDDYATVAYSAATGRQLWVSRYNGPANGEDDAWSMAVSPGGGQVFVTGQSDGGRPTGDDYATVAYSAVTGRQLWVSRYNGPASKTDSVYLHSVAVSPGGTTVYVTGQSTGRRTGIDDYATVAYSAATGRQVWVSRYNGPANGEDGASSVAASPDGSMVYVTGNSKGLTTGDDYATVAYSAVTGRQVWVSRYNGPANGEDGAVAVAVSPDGGRVFVTGDSYGGRAAGDDYATVAYSG